MTLPAAPRVLEISPNAFKILSTSDGLPHSEPRHEPAGCPPPVHTLLVSDGLKPGEIRIIGDPDSLLTWAKRHKLVVNREAKKRLHSTFKAETKAVVFYFKPDGQSKSKSPDTVAIGPIRMRFRSTEPIVPVSLGSSSRDSSEMRMYVVADTQVVPISEGLHWNNEIKGPFPLPGPADPDSNFSFWTKRPGRMTRSLTRPHGYDRDIVFRPYDPIVELGCSNPVHRAFAASSIGWDKRADGFEGLSILLNRAWDSEPGPDVYASLWALGQLADPRSGEILLRWTEHQYHACRTEALAALASCGAPEGMQIFLNTNGPEALQYFYRTKDTTAISPFRASADRNDGDSAWLGGWKKGGSEKEHSRFLLGLKATSTLAAMGDKTALNTIAEGVLNQAGVTSDSALVHQAVSASAQPRFTWSRFWLPQAMRAPMGMGTWVHLQTFMWEFMSVPEFRNAFLESLRTRPGIPEAGRVLLMACRDTCEGPDLDTLQAIAERSLRRPRAVATVRVWNIGDEYRTVNMNITAMAAMELLTKFRDVDRLHRLLPQAEASDPELASWVLARLATLNDPRTLARGEEEIREKWPAFFTSTEYRKKVETLLEDPNYVIWQVLTSFDISGTGWAMASHLRETQGIDWWTRALNDRSTPVLMRLFWISYAVTPEDMMVGRRALIQLREEQGWGLLEEKISQRIERFYESLGGWWKESVPNTPPQVPDTAE